MISLVRPVHDVGRYEIDDDNILPKLSSEQMDLGLGQRLTVSKNRNLLQTGARSHILSSQFKGTTELMHLSIGIVDLILEFCFTFQ